MLKTRVSQAVPVLSILLSVALSGGLALAQEAETPQIPEPGDEAFVPQTAVSFQLTAQGAIEPRASWPVQSTALRQDRHIFTPYFALIEAPGAPDIIVNLGDPFTAADSMQVTEDGEIVHEHEETPVKAAVITLSVPAGYEGGSIVVYEAAETPYDTPVTEDFLEDFRARQRPLTSITIERLIGQ